jgi:hypothetical protein
MYAENTFVGCYRKENMLYISISYRILYQHAKDCLLKTNSKFTASIFLDFWAWKTS